jgi:hypothetical protein
MEHKVVVLLGLGQLTNLVHTTQQDLVILNHLFLSLSLSLFASFYCMEIEPSKCFASYFRNI